MTRYHISFAGAGRVAYSLCNKLFESGHTIDTVVSDKGESARNLAKKCNSRWSMVPEFPETTEIIIVAVPDARLPEVLRGLIYCAGTVVAHTAGSFGLEVFPETALFKGVLYPLQTFSPGRKIDFKSLPLLIETVDEKSKKLLSDIALSTGAAVHYTNAESRRELHLAAVFVCNFVNYLLTSGNGIAEKAGFSRDILEPLIRETFSKAIQQGPENSQTGPAFRNDKVTIDKHLDLLSDSPDLQNLYRTITESIIKFYKYQRG